MTSFSLNGYEIAGLAVLAYAVVVYGLWRLGWIGRDRPISLLGPALMIKTKRGRDFIDRVGRRVRVWSIAGDIAIVLAAITMAAMVVLLLVDAVLSFGLSASQAPSAQEALGIPGINPIIPIGYGIVALIIGVALHELFHGFVARSQKIGVKSLGVLWCVVPVGAFVEQNDEDMEGASRRRRDRVAAAGVLANFILAFVCIVILSALVASSVAPNANGVGVVGTIGGSPAAVTGIGAGSIIVSVNGTPTTTNLALQNALEAIPPNTPVPIVYFSPTTNGFVTSTVRLEPLSNYTGNPADADKGFLGVSLSYLTPTQLAQTLVNPLTSGPNPLAGAVNWLVLPIAGLSPIAGGPQEFFHFTGPLAGADPGSTWIWLNLVYWLAWMNFLLGASNALPLIPLDGGLLVRDYAMSVAARFKRGWATARLEAFGGSVAVASSLVVVLLIVWQFVVPRL
ncbi:MAG: site-2 protease family protein [Thermoplasmata archaeon]